MLISVCDIIVLMHEKWRAKEFFITLNQYLRGKCPQDLVLCPQEKRSLKLLSASY